MQEATGHGMQKKSEGSSQDGGGVIQVEHSDTCGARDQPHCALFLLDRSIYCIYRSLKSPPLPCESTRFPGRFHSLCGGLVSTLSESVSYMRRRIHVCDTLPIWFMEGMCQLSVRSASSSSVQSSPSPTRLRESSNMRTSVLSGARLVNATRTHEHSRLQANVHKMRGAYLNSLACNLP